MWTESEELAERVRKRFRQNLALPYPISSGICRRFVSKKKEGVLPTELRTQFPLCPLDVVSIKRLLPSLHILSVRPLDFPNTLANCTIASGWCFDTLINVAGSHTLHQLTPAPPLFLWRVDKQSLASPFRSALTVSRRSHFCITHPSNNFYGCYTYPHFI